jgi:hypothetical protein
LIAKLFPDAKILLACRDPRDTVLSCVRHRFKMSAHRFMSFLSVEGAALYYDAVMDLGGAAHEHAGDRCLSGAARGSRDRSSPVK